MPIKLLVALAATTAFAAPADAAILLYKLQGTVANKWSASFQIDTAAKPVADPGFIFTYNPVSVTYTAPGRAERTVNAAVGFAESGNQGGLFINGLMVGNSRTSLPVFGPQLFTGAQGARTLLTGTFDMTDISRNFVQDPITVNYRLTVTDVTAAAVPEPATWALMLAGFGLSGVALRRSRARRVTFA